MPEKLARVRALIEAAPDLRLVRDTSWRDHRSAAYPGNPTDFVTLIIAPRSPVYDIAQLDKTARVLLPEDLRDNYEGVRRASTYFGEKGVSLPDIRIYEDEAGFRTATHLMIFPDEKLAEVYKAVHEMSLRLKGDRWSGHRAELEPLGWAILHDRVAAKWRRGEDLKSYYLADILVEAKGRI